MFKALRRKLLLLSLPGARGCCSCGVCCRSMLRNILVVSRVLHSSVLLEILLLTVVVHLKCLKPGGFLTLRASGTLCPSLWLPASRVCKQPSSPNSWKTKKATVILIQDKQGPSHVGGTFVFVREAFVPDSAGLGWKQPTFWFWGFSNNIPSYQSAAWPQWWFLLTPDGFHITSYFCPEIITLPIVNELNCLSPHFPTNYSELWTTRIRESPFSLLVLEDIFPCGQLYIIWLIYRAITYGIRGDLFFRALPQSSFFFLWNHVENEDDRFSLHIFSALS